MEKLTNHDSSRAGNIFKFREALHGRHGDLVADTHAKSEEHLGTDVHGLGGVDIQSVDQGHTGGHYEGTEELVGLCVTGLSDHGTADHGTHGEEGKEGESVDAAFDGRLPVNGLEIDGKVEHDLVEGGVRAERDTFGQSSLGYV